MYALSYGPGSKKTDFVAFKQQRHRSVHAPSFNLHQYASLLSSNSGVANIIILQYDFIPYQLLVKLVSVYLYLWLLHVTAL